MGARKESHDRIAKVVLDLYDIRESDLEMMEFTPLKWKCLMPMCNCGTTVRDYGVAPFYYCPRKGWGWVDGKNWWMMCGKHWKQREKIMPIIAHRLNEQYFLSHFQTHELHGQTKTSVNKRKRKANDNDRI